MIRFFLVGMLCLSLFACSSKKQVTQSEVTRITKEKVITYKDTVLVVPKKQTSLTIPIKEVLDTVIKKKTYRQTNDHATGIVTITKDSIIFKVICDSVALKAQIRQELIKESSHTNKEVEIIEQKGISRFKHYIGLLVAFVIGAVVGVILKIFIL